MSDNLKAFDSIMMQIISGLSGHAEARPGLSLYFCEQVEKYRNHEMGKKIVRACGRLAYERLPNDRKLELEKTIRNTSSDTAAILEEVRFNIYKKDFENALRLLEVLVDQIDEKRIEEEALFQDDRVNQYHVFDEYLEKPLYQHRYEPPKKSGHAQLPYPEISLSYGSLLFEFRTIFGCKAGTEKASGSCYRGSTRRDILPARCVSCSVVAS